MVRPSTPSVRGKSLRLSCPCDLHAVRAAAGEVRGFLEQEGISAEMVDGWELVLTEAANNAVRYVAPAGATRPIELVVDLTPEAVELRITDHTRGFQLPDRYELPPPDSESGRGLYLIHTLTDSMEYLRGRDGNCLVLRRRRPSITPPNPTPGAPPETTAGLVELEATLQTMTEELAASYESLSAIFRFTEDLARGGVNPAFVERWLRELMSITGADWMVLRLSEGEARRLRTMQTLPTGVELPPLGLPEEESPGLSVEVQAGLRKVDVWFDHRNPLAGSDPLGALGAQLSGFSHPMFVSGELMGVLTSGLHGESRTFTAGQVSIVQTLSDFLAIQIRDSRNEQARLQARLLRRDFEVASEIQRRLLPRDHPRHGPWVTGGFCESAQRVGGDFYDILPITPHCYLLAVADVMGKGLPAALFATVFRTLLRARRDLAPRPGAFLEWLNRDLASDLDDLEMFITAQLAYVDLQSRTLRVAGAGHPPLLLGGRGMPTRELASAGPPLGILPDLPFPEEALPLPPDTRLLMYTDGMTEVMNAEGEQVGVGPLIRILNDSVASRQTAEALRTQLLSQQTSVAGEAPAADDRTCVLLVEEPQA